MCEYLVTQVSSCICVGFPVKQTNPFYVKQWLNDDRIREHLQSPQFCSYLNLTRINDTKICKYIMPDVKLYVISPFWFMVIASIAYRNFYLMQFLYALITVT